MSKIELTSIEKWAMEYMNYSLEDIKLNRRLLQEELNQTKMSKRENQIRQELAILKIDLNSNYGFGRYEEERCQKIFDKISKLREELKSLNQNKDE